MVSILLDKWEELGFTNNFSLKKANLDAFSTMICIAHKENTDKKIEVKHR